MNAASAKSPFKFLDSYSADDQAIFFGRENEVDEVYDKVFQSKLLLVYGASGTGKSSIINCGLANRFEEADWFPIKIRRGGNIRRSLFQQIQKQAIQKVTLTDEEKQTNEGLQKVVNSVYLDHFKPIYLIFDQFEELFIFGFKDEWQDFISAIRFLMDTHLDLHFIFIIRGEYLEFLSEFEELIPEFFDNRIRVERMTRRNAVGTIQGPAKAHKIDLDSGFEEKLLKKISPEKSHIELTFLQVFLDKIYKKATSDIAEGESIRFTHDHIAELGQLGDVLAEFVDEQLFQMDDPKAALRVLKSFVSLQGTKIQKTTDEVLDYCADLGHPYEKLKVEKIIRSFVNKRILKDYDDNGKLELRHDSLAQKIFEKITNQERELLDVKQFLSYSLNEYQKRGTLLNDEDISYITFYERNLELTPDLKEFIALSKKHSTQRRKTRRLRSVIVSTILVLLLTSIVGLFYSQHQKRRAETLTALAETQRSLAIEQREKAIENAMIAEQQTSLAQNQKLLAVEASNEAHQQRLLALEQKAIADEERNASIQARIMAEKSEMTALQQKEIAEEQQSIALRLRTLALARQLAIKSTYSANDEIKTLLSLQSLHFNQQNGGNPNDPDIYQSLYLARKTYYGNEDFYAPHSSALKDMYVSRDKIYTIGNDGRLMLFQNGAFTTLLQQEYAYEKFTILDSNRLAIGTQNGTLIVFNFEQSTVEFEGQIHSQDITAIAAIDETIVTTGLDGKIVFIDSRNFTISNTWDMQQPVRDMIHQDNNLWILKSDGLVKSTLNQKQTQFLSTKDGKFLCLEYDEMQNQLYIGTQKGEIWVWDTTSRQPLQILSGHSSAVTDMKLDAQAKYLASSSLDRTVRVWPLYSATSQPIVLNDLDNWASTLAFHNGQILTGSYSGSLKIFKLSMDELALGLCEKVGRSLTPTEWREYISDEIIYDTSCEN